MSVSMTLYGLLGCLKRAEDILGSPLWAPGAQGNEAYKQWLTESVIPAVLHEATPEALPDLESIASYSAEEINAFLKERGFDIEISDFQAPDFGLAAVLSVLLRWAESGVATKRTVDDVEYPYVRFNDGPCRVFETESRYGVSKGVKFDTKSADVVYVIEASEAPMDVVELSRMVEEIRAEVTERRRADLVLLPMIDHDAEMDLSWLLGLTDQKSSATVTEAKQQNKLRLNHEGVKAESATVLGMAMSAPGEGTVVVFERPFFLWIERPGMSFPLFAAYVTPEDWKDPGSLGDDDLPTLH